MVNIRRVFLNPFYLLALTVIQVSILLILIVTWSQPTPVTVTLSFLVPSTSPLDWDSLKKEFEAKNRYIQLGIYRVEAESNSLHDSYSKALATGNSPYDLIYMDIIWVSKFAANGWLLELSNWISKDELAKFESGDVQGGKYKKELYRIPFHSDVGMLYYRKDWLKEFRYQPPETFEQLLQISKALQKQKGIRWGFVWQARQYEGLVAMFLEVLKGYGGFWIENDQVGLDKPEALQAVKFLRTTIEQKISPGFATFSSEQEYSDTFLNGETVFLRSWPYVWTEAEAKNSPIRGKIGFTAMVHAPGDESAACRGGWGFGIAKSAKHREEAWRVIQFFTSEETQRKFLLDKGFLPSIAALLSKPKIPDDKRYETFSELLHEKSVLRPPISKYKEASEILQCHLRDALTGALSPEEAMKAAANETHKLLTGRVVPQNPCYSSGR